VDSLELFQKFMDNLDKEIGWRKQELENLKLHIESIFKEDLENTEEKGFLLRGGIALTYAHWEGGIKKFFIYHVKYLNELLKEKIINIENVDSKLLETMIFYKIEKQIGYNNSEKRQKIISFCKKIFSSDFKIEIDKQLVDTKSNLKFDIYIDLIEKLGINLGNFKNEIEIEKLFIKKLVERRNYIAHGQKLSELSEELVIESIKKVIKLLDLNKEILINNARELINLSLKNEK
jgi:hypothetical protein